MKKLWIGLAIVVLLGIFLWIPIQGGFEVSTVRDHHVLKYIPSESRQLTISWRHSVELQPWMEMYKVDKDGRLVFQETRFKAYGAGVPAIDGKVERLEDGFLVVRGIERKLDHYSLFYSPNSHYTLQVNGSNYPLKDFVSPDTAVNISFKEITLIEQIWYSWGGGSV